MVGKASFAFTMMGALAVSAMAGCAPRARMCTATAECVKDSACVAGRCQPQKAHLKPAVDSARRWVVRPIDLAYVSSRDATAAGAPPQVFALGRSGGVLFLRFSVAVPKGANVVEAYVCLRRAEAVDDDPVPITLHATRIVDPWEGGSTSWTFQPRLREVRTPATIVEPDGPSLVRVDVRDLVRHWSKHDPSDQGIAVVAENESPTGTTFATTALGSDAVGAGSDFDGASGFASTGRRVATRGHGIPAIVSAPDVAPYLELYVR